MGPLAYHINLSIQSLLNLKRYKSFLVNSFLLIYSSLFKSSFNIGIQNEHNLVNKGKFSISLFVGSKNRDSDEELIELDAADLYSCTIVLMLPLKS